MIIFGSNITKHKHASKEKKKESHIRNYYTP